MATSVGIREFRDNLSTYLLQSEAPVTITRHGDAIGYFVPARPRLTTADRDAIEKRTEVWQQSLDAAGITEEQAVEDFKRLRAEASRR